MTPPPDLLEAARALLGAQPGGQALVMCLGDGTPWHAVGARHVEFFKCPACALRRAIAHEQGLRDNAQIRTGPLLPVARTHDAAGVRRMGYRPEEDEGEE